MTITTRGAPGEPTPVHYVLTHAEHEAARGGYVDPARYRKEDPLSWNPEVLCLYGGFHIRITREVREVTCGECMVRLERGRELVARRAEADGEVTFAREVRAGAWDGRTDVIKAAVQ